MYFSQDSSIRNYQSSVFQMLYSVQSRSLASFVSRCKALHADVPENTHPGDSDGGRQDARRIH